MRQFQPQILASLSLCVMFAVSTTIANPSKLNEGTATYLGNEALLIQHGDTKVLFDPFFHNNYQLYQLVPQAIVSALMDGEPPYDNIDAIFISHAHGDHFSSQTLVKFLNHHPEVRVIAPSQAISEVESEPQYKKTVGQLIEIDLEYEQQPLSFELGQIKFDVVRIPHAGWPQRAEVSNLVYRVSLNDEVTVVHMGDADPNDAHFSPLVDHWQKTAVNTAFPPYWFFLSQDGRRILSQRISAEHNIGIHVPTTVPNQLKQSEHRFFSIPTQTIPLR